MSNLENPRIIRWPFVVADLLLLGVATGIVMLGHRPLLPHETLAVAGLVAVGAWVMILPFLRDHDAAVKLWEQSNLAGAAQQLAQVHQAAEHMRQATAQWQKIHESAVQAAETATGAADRVTAEARTFAELLGRSNDQEKQALRLEIDKLRRGGTEHLQAIVHVLDHVYALFQAAQRAGAHPLTTQLGQFRAACLDAVRRIGLLSFEAQPGDPFDGQMHQTPDGQAPPAGSVVAATIACGFTYQAQPLRRILVSVQKTGNEVAGSQLESAEESAGPEETPQLPLSADGPS